ncbi:universal stress protein [Qaidamihabitans albus]|uniref:universal stress protein n=1 Tax=Qaidamihabitans albus TaxID=2795733 RepID=UPI0018F20842|nr:universal stress protein [Qaidamihabitans albus]
MSATDIAADPIVVGVDGSAAATEALRWAARAAVQRNADLRIVHGYGYAADEFYRGELPPAADIYAALDADSERILAAAAEEAGTVADGLVVRTAMPPLPPVRALVEESRAARMVVLGSSGRGGFTGMLTGSTAVAVTSHAACPVTVVRYREGEARPPVEGPVVVGVDGSPVGERAIAAAFEEASLREAPLVAVHAWLDVEYDSAFNQARVYFEGGPHEQDEQRLLAERLAGWPEKYPDVQVERVVVLDRPRHQLLERSRTAQLVVVGSRGRGGFRGMLLGSTSQALIHHAECPVLVVRPGEVT